MTNRTRASVQAGLCFQDSFGYCAFTADDCDDPSAFMSSRLLQIVSGAHGGRCLLRRYTEDINIGSCGDRFCTSVAAACSEGTPFQERNDLCDIVQSDNLDRSLFGSCDDRCSWSSQDCGANEIWKVASKAKSCVCEDVRVGACFYQGVYYCAVANASCDSVETWIPATTLLNQPNAPDCRLCRDRIPVPIVSVINVTSSVTTTSPPISESPGTAPTNNTKRDETIRDADVDLSGQSPVVESIANKGIILGVALGGGLIILTIIIMFLFALHRLRKQQTKNTNETKEEADEGPPIHNLVLGDRSTEDVEPDLDELSATWSE